MIKLFFVTILGFSLGSTIAYSANKSCQDKSKDKWAYEQCVVSIAKSKLSSKPPYWLIDFNENDAFASASKKMADKISGYKISKNASLCFAVFMNSPRAGKDASLYCVGDATTNGYDKVCSAASANLGTEQVLKQSTISHSKCDKESMFTVIRMTDMLLQSEFFDGGFIGNLGVFVFKDDSNIFKKWFDYWGEVNKPKETKSKKR